MKLAWAITVVSLVLCSLLGYNTWTVQKDNQKLSLENLIYQAEHRILKDEIATQDRKPTYEQGYKDALVLIGGPQTPGAYQDGWDDAMKVYFDASYADGYHAAIQQFGYTKTSTMARWLAPEPSKKKMEEGGIPAKFSDKK